MLPIYTRKWLSLSNKIQIYFSKSCIEQVYFGNSGMWLVFDCSGVQLNLFDIKNYCAQGGTYEKFGIQEVTEKVI